MIKSLFIFILIWYLWILLCPTSEIIQFIFVLVDFFFLPTSHKLFPIPCFNTCQAFMIFAVVSGLEFTVEEWQEDTVTISSLILYQPS